MKSTEILADCATGWSQMQLPLADWHLFVSNTSQTLSTYNS